jgi:ABC-type lipoprotein export system ATPase subunit
MFKVTSVSITGFWQAKKASSSFQEDVNIIIGKNGSGKTTFMNILHAVLAVDAEALYENAFHSVHITLNDGKRTRTIRANRIESPSSVYPTIEYHISNRKFFAPLVGGDDIRTRSPMMRRRALEETQRIKLELDKLVSVASLSVYRIGGDPDPDLRERVSRRYASTVDIRLASLMQHLTQYQLELSNQARTISSELQREVLTSLLYSEDKAKNAGYRLEFDEVAERQKLTSAYKQLGVSGPDILKKIQDHISAVSKAVKAVKELSKANSASAATKPVNIDLGALGALDSLKLTTTVVGMSLTAEEKTKAIFSQIHLFLDTLASFISGKEFKFEAGELVVVTKDAIPLSKLSSGEKQLLILFIEALLQRQLPYIFLADEPELSLHISWQRNIISAIRSINPNAQIIVATHSPEIAGKFRDKIVDMEDLLHG